jgi:sulfite exporter TauE/SafE
MFQLTAFIMGFLGSFHCIGMCGPIALSLPVDKTSAASVFSGRLLYNAGRIITYSLMGLVFGLFGHAIAMSGFQKNLSISVGVIILFIVVFSFAWKKIDLFNRVIGVFTSKLKNIFRQLFGQRSRLTLFLIGVVNGLLPCGFVYLALAGAAATGNFMQGMSYMFLFGLGTIPVMLSISLAGNMIGFRFQKLIRKVTPFVAIALAAFLIYRGLMLPVEHCCHH